MKSPFAFIVKPLKGKRYNNTKEMSGLDIIISTSEEDFRFANREAEVIELPLGYKGPIKVGDFLLVHHNVFKFYNDMKGTKRSGKSYFKDDLFFVEKEQFYMYHNGTQWNACDRYCFVKPAPVEESYVYKPLSEEPLVGVMEYPNDYLKSKGVTKGDKVCYKPNSEYEFIVDDVKMYRMFDHQIVMSI
jgi:hypothetical protein